MKSPKIVWTVVIVSALLFACINRFYFLRNFQLLRLNAVTCPPLRSDCKNIFWAHRVNTIEKYKELEHHFPGFETDLTYIDSLQRFLVFHPPFNSTKDTLSWGSFANSVDLENKKLYIDMREVDSSNMYNALKAFEADLNTDLLKKQIVIELYDCEAVSFFNQLGYNVSISYSAINTLFTLNKDNEAYRNIIHDKLKNITQISGDAALIEEMKEIFPDKKYIVWSLSSKNYLNLKLVSDIIADDKIALVLVSILSSHNR